MLNNSGYPEGFAGHCESRWCKEAGFEPAKLSASDLESDPFDRSGTPAALGEVFLLSSTDEEARKKINKGIIHGLPLSAVSQVAHMIDEVASSRLSKQELIVVEKALFELTEQQKIKSEFSEKKFPIPNFWSSIRQLLTHLENESAETIRNEGMNAKPQLQSRRLGVARTSVSDLTRLRMNAFAQHAILSNLIKSPDGKQNENQVTQLIGKGTILRKEFITQELKD